MSKKWFKDKTELEDSFKDLKPLLEYFTEEELKSWFDSDSIEKRIPLMSIKDGKMISI